jgi:cell envelope opacity-associated protein A
LIHPYPKTHILAASFIGVVITLVLTLSPSSNVNATRTSTPIELDALQPTLLNEITQLEEKKEVDAINMRSYTAIETKKQQPRENWQTITIKDGHSLSTIFSLAGLNDKIMYSVLGRKKQNKSLSRIFPGEKLAFLQNDKDELSKVKLIRSPLESI